MNVGSLNVSDAFVKIFVVIVLLLSTNALIPLLRQGGSGAGGFGKPAQGEDLATQFIWLAVYGIVLFLFVVHRRRCLQLATREKLLMLLIGVALISVLWSVEPAVTLRRSIALAATTLFGVYLTARFNTGELLRLLAWALGIAALLSLVFALALPSYGIGVDERGAVWQGIFVHKNLLGRVMALSVVVFLLIALERHRYRWIAWAGCGLSVVLLLMSGSVAAALTLLTLLALLPLYRASRSHHFLAIPSFIVATLASIFTAALLVNDMGNVLDALGRDPTLTGRTDVWDAVLEMIRQRPWLGYGYGGFWLGWEGESAHVWLRSGIEAAHAHNGFLNLWLNLGLLGLLVFVLGLLRAFLRAIASIRSTRNVEGFWPLVYLTFVLIYNMTESSLLGHNDVFWILYVAVTLSLFDGRFRTRRAAQSGAPSGRRTGAQAAESSITA